MGASRENMSIWKDIKSKNWTRLQHKLKMVFSKHQGHRWNKEMILKDSFSTPFNELIGCKFFGHKWSTKEEMIKYDLINRYCWKCTKHSTISDFRNEKISKLLK